MESVMNTIPNNQSLPGSALTDPSQLEELGKQAAQLAETGISLTDAVVDTVGHLKLNQEQVRRVVESANITAVNMKYASSDPSFRYPVLDDGPANPVEVMQRVVAATSAQPVSIDAFEYAGPPSTKFASIQIVPDYVEDDSAAVRSAALRLLDLRTKLSAAQDELVQRVEATKGQLELELMYLDQALKTAQVNGAVDSEIYAAWSEISTAVADAVWRKLEDVSPPQAQKVAGRRLSPEHPVMTKFAGVVHALSSLAGHQSALRAVEAELQHFFSEDCLKTRSIELLKAASAPGVEAASALGKGLRKALAGAGKVVTLAGDAGQGLAEGLGGGELAQGVGRTAGNVAALGGMYAGVRHVGQKIDDTIEDVKLRRELRRQQRASRIYGGM